MQNIFDTLGMFYFKDLEFAKQILILEIVWVNVGMKSSKTEDSYSITILGFMQWVSGRSSVKTGVD